MEQLKAGCSIVTLHQDCGISKTQFRRLCLSVAEGPALYPEVSQTLAELQKRGVPLGVVTSLPGWLVELLLRRAALEPHFTTVIHPGNCPGRKPSPKPLEAAL